MNSVFPRKCHDLIELLVILNVIVTVLNMYFQLPACQILFGLHPRSH